MKKLLIILMLVIVAGCTTERTLSNGKTYSCIGLDRDNEDKSLTYKISKKNVILAVIFSETIFVPIIVVMDEVYCPVEAK